MNPPAAPDNGIYEPVYVRRLFDEMAKTYGIVNLISSFGFAAYWRRQCVSSIALQPGWTVLDMMTGMGELCPSLACQLGRSGRIRAIDLSPVMCARARRQVSQRLCPVEIVEGDALRNEFAAATADAVASSFGLKTFSVAQLGQLADEIARVLKPGGPFALVEISVPPGRWLRWPYLFYIKRVIPLIGRLFLGNPENYRMLGVYTEAFGNCARMQAECVRAGLVAHEVSYFMGCATGIVGFKPR